MTNKNVDAVVAAYDALVTRARGAELHHRLGVELAALGEAIAALRVSAPAADPAAPAGDLSPKVEAAPHGEAPAPADPEKPSRKAPTLPRLEP